MLVEEEEKGLGQGEEEEKEGTCTASAGMRRARSRARLEGRWEAAKSCFILCSALTRSVHPALWSLSTSSASVSCSFEICSSSYFAAVLRAFFDLLGCSAKGVALVPGVLRLAPFGAGSDVLSSSLRA